MDIFWDRSAWEDYQYWLRNDKKVLKKINRLIKEYQRTPFEGTGNRNRLKEIFSVFGQGESQENTD